MSKKNVDIVPINKKNAKTISDFVKKHNPVSKKTDFVIENGKSVEKTAYSIPRKFLTLNTANHRFSTSVHELIEERIEDGKSPDFDMKKKFDVDQIRNMLRGIYPVNPDRKTNFDKLYDEVGNHSEQNGGNGLKSACIVTADGIFVNGNRRDTVLEDLQSFETKKKKGGDPSKFDTIDVVICDNLTYSDIRQMEIKEQVSANLRDEYDYMNTSLLIKEEFDNLLAKHGDDKRDQVIKTIASRIEGKGTKSIVEYLDFLEFVDAVLEQLHLQKQYHKINTKIQNESKPVTTIVREWQSKWSKAKNPDRKLICVMVCAAYCQGVFKTAKDPGPDSSYQFNSRNHRNFKKYEKSKIAKNLIEDISYWENHKFDSDADAEAFGDKIHLSDEHVKNEQWLEKPAKVLKSIKGSLLIIDEALSNSKKDDVKSRLVAAKVSLYLDEFTTHISNINDKIK